MIKDEIKLVGRVRIEQFDASMHLVQTREINNIVVAAGKAFIAARMLGTTAAVMSHMGLGSDGTVQSTLDTTLVAETGRVALANATNTLNSCLYVAQFAPGVCTGEIREAAVFNDATVGQMLCRTTFPVINKEAADTIIVSWVITIS